MNKLRILLTFIFGITMFLGCQEKWGEPDFKVEDWVGPTQANSYFTIGPNGANNRYVLAKHPILGTAPDSIMDPRSPNIRYLKAVVVSSDEGGNYYKSMVIQDSTGGVELELDMNGLYNTYPVGQKVVIVLNGLVIGDYHHLPQIGWIYNGNQVGRINSLFFDKYIIKDGLPSLKNVPKPLTNNEIDFSSEKDINKLVRLENVIFKENAIGNPLAYNDFTTEWIIKVPLANGKEQEVTVRTSNYAKFRNTIIENKQYNLTGILTVYVSGNKTTYQLMIRTKEDIVNAKSDEFLEFDFTSNPIGEGKWSVQQLISGSTTWKFRGNCMAHIGNKVNQIAMDDWLISPVITYPDLANGYVRFEHQIKIENGQYGAYQVYYTTSTSPTFNATDWKVLGTVSNFPELYDWSNRLSIAHINANTFRLAFRYQSTNPEQETYEWDIRKVEIRNK